MSYGKSEERRLKKGVESLAKMLEEERRELLNALNKIKEESVLKETEWKSTLAKNKEEIENLKKQMKKEENLRETEVHSMRGEKTFLAKQLAVQKSVFDSEIKDKEAAKDKLEKGIKELAKKVEEERMSWEERLDVFHEEMGIISNELKGKDIQLKSMREYYLLRERTDLCIVRLEERFKDAKIRNRIKVRLKEELDALPKMIEEEREPIMTAFEKMQEENRGLREEILKFEAHFRKYTKSGAGSGRSAMDVNGFSGLLPGETAGKDDMEAQVSRRIKNIAQKLEEESIKKERNIKEELQEEIRKNMEANAKIKEEFLKIKGELQEKGEEEKELNNRINSLKENIIEKDKEIDSLMNTIGKNEKKLEVEEKNLKDNLLDLEMNDLEKIFEKERRMWKEKLKKNNGD